MPNEMRDRLVNLINQDNCPSPFMCSNECKYAHLKNCCGDRLADHLIENGVIVPPCKVGETLYLIQIDYESNYFMTTIVVSSKITMLSILRAYEEKTIVYMSTDKNKAEEELQKLKGGADNG